MSNSLNTGLKTRHLTMMGLGSAIGAGLFLGTGVGIQAAGPAVIIAYVIAGVATVAIMTMLAELVAARPSSGSFATYADMAYGRWAGFTVGWAYWFMQVLIIGVEITGASAVMSNWFDIDPWIPALIAVLFFTAINLLTVRGFGEFEFWFALIKIGAIIIFLVLGTLMIFGLFPGVDAVGTSNLTDVGFMPNGIGGVATAMLAVAFAFGGIELVTIAAAESENPHDAVHSAIRSAIWRIAVFYIGSVLLIVLLLPYGQIAGADTAAESPFTLVLSMANIPGAVGIMEVVIVLALLSACNAQIYGNSRLLYSMARGHDAPAYFSATNSQGVPVRGVLVSILFAFVSVGLQFWNPPELLTFLLNAVGGLLIGIWTMIVLSYLRLHSELVDKREITDVRMPGYPWTGWATLTVIVGFIVLMLFDEGGRTELISSMCIIAVVVAAGFIVHRENATRPGSMV